MTTAKRSSNKKQVVRAGGPGASRPSMPPDYGVPKDTKGLLPWSHVSERMAKAMHYWICTVSPEGRPHATPVDGLWIEDQFYFGGSPQTRRNRNLAANPAVCIHLEDGMDVVILHGDALEVQGLDHALAARLSEESRKKYGYGPTPEQYQKTRGMYAFRPGWVLAWKNFPKDATRWRFDNRG